MSAVLKAVQPATETLESLVDKWIEQKRAEEEAAKRRVAIEEAIIARTGERDEGAQTHELADGRKLTVTAKITRTVDEALWRQVESQVPAELRPVQWVQSAKLDTKGLHWLIENCPEVYAVVARALTAKKAKSSISVKAV